MGNQLLQLTVILLGRSRVVEVAKKRLLILLLVSNYFRILILAINAMNLEIIK